ncbi:hypothetical protein [Methylocystis parvus]|uniref:Uncharacterized protein n=1 Tax=Methylocystis parvus TaxID=134 RepID=A0A6B8MED0_9HYPH|nr:hypothetical protein [Methylocystis parvus]QGN00093.1 hypothetical protein F7D14_21150 [Methylocystis parvus]WBK02410.1 hypothetical protein MMG94_21490 [Methylocystis parvus OBBP]
MRNATSCLVAALVAACFTPIAAAADERGAEPKYSQDDLLDGTTVAIASQDICGFKVDQNAIRAFVAAKAPDMPWFLFDAQIRGYQRIMPRFSEQEKARHCAKARLLTEVAGWIR